MDRAGLIVFATALFLAAASPGPGIAAIVARVLGRGARGAVAFSAGVAIGDVVWLGVAVLGLAVIAETLHGMFVVIKYAGAAYLLYLAYRLWTAPVVTSERPVHRPCDHPLRLFAGGLAVTMGNPKVMVFYLALLPTILDVARVGILGFAELVAVTLAILTIVFGAYILLVVRARRLFASPRALRLAHRATGAMMAGAATAIATR